MTTAIATEADSNDSLLTYAELATRLKTTESAVKRLRRNGRIPHIELGPHLIRFSWPQVQIALGAVVETGGSD